jgi:uncharacterized membrane protein YeaQ/YmgE (transglycosylase-associated protein family)
MAMKDLVWDCCRQPPESGHLVGLLTWILVGLVAGFIAQFVLGGGGGLSLRGLVITVLLGIGGALLGGFISSAMGYGDVTGFNVQSLVIATLGALVVVFVFRAMAGRRSGGLI